MSYTITNNQTGKTTELSDMNYRHLDYCVFSALSNYEKSGNVESASYANELLEKIKSVAVSEAPHE